VVPERADGSSGITQSTMTTKPTKVGFNVFEPRLRAYRDADLRTRVNLRILFTLRRIRSNRRDCWKHYYRTAPSIAEPFVPHTESRSICSRKGVKQEIGSSGWIRTRTTPQSYAEFAGAVLAKCRPVLPVQ
jgi:hypothetical protein